MKDKDKANVTNSQFDRVLWYAAIYFFFKSILFKVIEDVFTILSVALNWNVWKTVKLVVGGLKN